MALLYGLIIHIVVMPLIAGIQETRDIEKILIVDASTWNIRGIIKIKKGIKIDTIGGIV